MQQGNLENMQFFPHRPPQRLKFGLLLAVKKGALYGEPRISERWTHLSHDRQNPKNRP
jgi:hypothetical protein